MALSDTVGFIRDLSHSLVEAFKATLESAVQADVLLHVVDAGSPTRHTQIEEVNKVLAEIGAQEVPQVLVWNKIDTCERPPEVERGEDGRLLSVAVSARFGLGLAELRACLGELAGQFYAPTRDPGQDEDLSAW